VRERDDEQHEDEAQRPSKSQRKRAAHAAQDLGEALIRLTDAELAALELPENLLEALQEARRIGARGGGARQRQYIGKLMRGIELEPLRAALGARSEQQSRDAQLFKRIESWRERLIGEGAAALEELERWRPELDRPTWMRLIAAAQAERRSGAGSPGQGSPGTSAARELFRALRELLAAHPEPAPTGTMRR
jgi:ribosome-associated protein